MRVAVTQRVDAYLDRGEKRDALDQRLTSWLWANGYLPVPLPNTLGDAGPSAVEGWLSRLDIRGLIVSGGNDIGSEPARDATEGTTLDFAQTHLLPVLGICRGMQMMAMRDGGRLVPLDGHVRTRHALVQTGNAGGPWPREVNSFHDWGIAQCPPNYTIECTSPDGFIEAFSHRTLPWEGWMWHPEREQPISETDTTRLRNLFGSPSSSVIRSESRGRPSPRSIQGLKA